MKNIKRILSLILIIFVILSAFALNKVYAIKTEELYNSGIKGCSNDLTTEYREKEKMPEELEETAIHSGVDKNSYTLEFTDGQSLVEQDLMDQYPLFCRDKSTRTLMENDDTFETEDGKVITVEYKYDQATGTVSVEPKTKEYYRSYWWADIYYLEATTHSFYKKVKDVKYAKPDEAYVLAEMINNNTDGDNRAKTFKIIDKKEGFFDKTGTTLDASVLQLIEMLFDETLLEPAGYLEIEPGIFGTYYKYKVTLPIFGEYEVDLVKINNTWYTITETGSDTASTPWASYVQWGWWHTDAGGADTNKLLDDFFSKEMNEFQIYIDSVAKKDASGNYIYNDVYTFTENSKEYTVTGPQLEYNPTFDYERAEVLWDSDSETYKVGPFSIDYVKSIIEYTGGNRYRFFAGIIDEEDNFGCQVKSNIGDLTLNTALNSSKQYRFYYPSGKAGDELPNSNEEFYIEFKQEEGLTEIQDINFKFKYMNAGGKYQQLEGNKYKASWKVNVHSGEDIDGDGDKDRYKRTVENIGIKKEKVQDFSYGISGARWYKETEIHSNKKWTTTVTHKGDLKIVKNIVDQDGNPIQVKEDKLYKFKITTIRANEDGEYKNTSGGYLDAVEEIVTIIVPKGSSTGNYTSKIETWEGDKAPLYIVEEIEAAATQIEDYSYGTTKIENGKGQYIENNTSSGAVVTVTNIYTNNDDVYKKGRLEIVKKVNVDVTKERVFEFDITINTDGKIIKETAKIVVPKGTKKDDETKWVSSEYTWKTGATYKIEEKSEPGYATISPMSGSLTENAIKRIDVTNKETGFNRGKIQIVKQLIDKDGKTYKATQDETFSFEVYINGQYDRDVIVTVPKGSSTAKSAEIEYEWLASESAPKCKIVEKEHGNYKLSYIDEEKQLENGNIISFTAINAKVDIGGNHGNLQIKKTVDKAVVADTKFKFEVVIDGEKREEAEIIIAKGQKEGLWKSEEYYWEGSALAYEVREIDISSNYKLESITNKTGYLSNGKTISITAVNKLTDNEEETGKIKIVKKLTDLNGNIFVADKDYTFKFNVAVEGKGNENLEITIKEGDSEGSVESKEYKWKKNEKAPNYVVKETDSKGLIPAMSNATGVLDNQTIEVIAINKVEKEYDTKIKLYKKLIGENGNPVNVEKDTEYYFRVFVTKEDGSEYKYEPTVIVKRDQNYGDTTITDSSNFTWKEGELAPTFRVEEQTPTGEWKEIAIENDNNNLIAGETVVGCYNTDGTTENHHKGELQIVKKLVYEERDEKGNLIKDAEGNPIKVEVAGKEFKFNVVVKNVIIDPKTNEVGKWEKDIIIKAGDSWAKEFIWKDGITPTYEVTELDEKGNKIDPDNDENYGYDCTINHIYQETDYSSATGTKNGVNSSKELKANNTVLVEVENKFKEDGPKVYKGSVAIQKILEVEDKIALPDIPDGDKTFKFKVTIYYDDPNEYFTYGGNAYNTLEIYKNIVGPGTAGPIEIKYYENGNAPKYVVEEIGYPSGWELVSANNVKGKVDSTQKAVFTNRLPINRKYILTMELGGQVWNDTNYSNGKPTDSGHNGLKEEIEPGMGNVIVNVYSTTDGLFTTLLTDTNGKWQIPTMNVPAKNENYYVTYTYDGQTYEPTKSLMKKDGSKGTAENFKTNNTSNEDDDEANRLQYLDGSMAIENEGERNTFNNKFAQIWGESSIENDGTTSGKATGYDLEYISKDIEYNGYSKKASELVTLLKEDKPDTPYNDIGTAKYPMTASTAEIEPDGLYYPFDNKTALVSVDKTIEETSTSTVYRYHAAYPYLNNINLGLVERPHADIAIEKELEEAIVVVNGKIYKYKYGEIANAQFAEYPDLLYKQIQVNQKNIEYSLNLYKSDYYYRASVYTGVNGNLAYDANSDGDVNNDDNIGKMLDTYLRNSPLNISDGLDSLNLEVYLTYKISVRNESDVYDVQVNQISDYVDSSLKLVTAPEYKYIDNTDGTSVGTAVVVADKPTNWEWNISGHSENHGWGTVPVDNIEDNTPGWRKDATDKTKYDRYISTGISAKEIKSGETVSSKLTFKVNKSSDIFDPGINECIQLGDKYNIVEIDNYSTYYAGTSKVAGRVDEDSAPGNINIPEKNSINWYEDDTDRSPVLRLGLYESVRNINGIAWEDQETNNIEYDQIIGDGVLPFTVRASDGKLIPDETPIKNMTTTLVEKVTIDGIDYDFIWPTGGLKEDGSLESSTFDINGKTVYELTGLDSEILTSNETDKEGTYVFAGIPAGDYVVRFTYGDDNTLKEVVDEHGNVVYDANGNIVYEKDANGNIKYSGQDYKSTTYQTSVDTNADGIFDWNASQNISGGYLSNEWHDLESETFSTLLSEVRVSDARDDESRRLEVIAKSQNMFYENTSIMDTNDSSYTVDDGGVDPFRTTDDSLETYFMEANTAKLNMNIESVLNSRKGIVDGNTYYDTIKNVGGVDVHVLNTNRKLSNGDSISVKLIKYDVNNIDFGIETRSENNVVLDKQIEQITLKTSAGDILIDAIYDISYNPDATVNISLNPASIGTENLQALNRGTTPGDLGFRYLNVDKDLLQGAMITIKYRITALNTGEVDRCNQALIDLGEFAEETASGLYQYTSNFETQLNRIRTEEANATTGYVYGQYLGQIYYQGATIGTSTADAVVTSKIKQVIDYVDNDVVFSQMENIDQNTSWTNTTTAELEENRYIDNTLHNEPPTILYIKNFGTSDYSDDKILDSNGVAYESESKNNLIVSVENDSGTTLANPNLMTAITPYDHTTGSNHNSYVNVTVSRYYSSDMDIEEIENIAETLKLYNDVGRRDLQTIQGNTKPALGPVDAAFGENDSSATELITLSPPTGTLISTMLTLQVMAIALVAITILAGGIYLIKRKVVIK